MTVKNTTKIQIGLREDDPVMEDIGEISKHDNISEQEAVNRALTIFLPEGVYTPGQRSNNHPDPTQPDAPENNTRK